MTKYSKYGGFAETASEPVSAKLAYWLRRGKQIRKVTDLNQDLTSTGVNFVGYWKFLVGDWIFIIIVYGGGT